MSKSERRLITFRSLCAGCRDRGYGKDCSNSGNPTGTFVSKFADGNKPGIASAKNCPRWRQMHTGWVVSKD